MSTTSLCYPHTHMLVEVQFIHNNKLIFLHSYFRDDFTQTMAEARMWWLCRLVLFDSIPLFNLDWNKRDRKTQGRYIRFQLYTHAAGKTNKVLATGLHKGIPSLNTYNTLLMCVWEIDYMIILQSNDIIQER